MSRPTLSILMRTALLWLVLVAQAQAAVVGTQQALAMDARNARIDEIKASLAREDVRQAIVALGVDPAQAGSRVAALSDRELAQLQGQLNSLPAGGDTLVLIGAVFVVLLILELTGVIDIFKKA
ncbi:MAG: PA2779 family protein [Xanthomonadales bacterium]|nr:PA2779 family protein [Xanthomonadales bacterium]